MDISLRFALSSTSLAICALLGGILIAGNRFFVPHPLGLIFYIFALCSLVLATRAWIRHQLVEDNYRTLLLPMLWMIFSWRVTLELGEKSSYAIPLTLLTVGLVSSMSPRVIRFNSLIVAAALELLVSSHLSLSITELGIRFALHSLIVFFFLTYLPRPRIGRLFIPTLDRLSASTPLPSVAALSSGGSDERDFGLVSHQLPPQAQISSLRSIRAQNDQEHSALELLKLGFELELEQLARSFSLDSALILWRQGSEQLAEIRAIHTEREQWLPGPYPLSGVLAAGIERQVMVNNPEQLSQLRLPYYPAEVKVGGLVITPLPPLRGEGAVNGLLCVDRSSAASWGEAQLVHLQLSAKRLAIKLEMRLRVRALARERNVVERLCSGLKALNHTLTTQEVIEVALEAIKVHKKCELIAFCRRSDEQETPGYRIHRFWLSDTVHTGGELQGTWSPLQGGLVGEVFQKDRLAISRDRLSSMKPIFYDGDGLDMFRSSLLLPLRDRQGSVIGVLALASCKRRVFDAPHGEPLEVIAEQISVKLQLAQLYEQMHYLAEHDGLTQLKNHRVFQEQLVQWVTGSRQSGRPIALLLADIDYFKQINDGCGHPFGDQVLQSVAQRFALARPHAVLAARYGGEEFALLLEEANEEMAIECAEQLRHEISELVLYHQGGPVRVTISIGVASAPEGVQSAQELLKRADLALYRAKELGRDQVVPWSLVPDGSGPGWTSTYQRPQEPSSFDPLI
ncbi:MAG: diguanylate cyclase [Myxococcota bacterium]|nr:diguanylate cyclase [Myxococcota bacterium]